MAGGVSRLLRMGRNSSRGKPAREAPAGSRRSFAGWWRRSVRSSSTSSGLRGRAPWAAKRRSSLGTPPLRNCSTKGFVTRASDMDGQLLWDACPPGASSTREGRFFLVITMFRRTSPLLPSGTPGRSFTRKARPPALPTLSTSSPWASKVCDSPWLKTRSITIWPSACTCTQQFCWAVRVSTKLSGGGPPKARGGGAGGGGGGGGGVDGARGRGEGGGGGGGGGAPPAMV